MDNCRKTNKKFSIFFIVACLMFCLAFFLLDWKWLNDVNYTLHEMMAISINLGFFIIPIGAIIWLIIFVQYQIKTDKTTKKPINTLLNVFSVVSLLLCILTFSYFMGQTTTFGVAENVQKYEVNQDYYININDTNIKVSEQQYKSITNDTSYLFSYTHGKWILGEYSKLEYIKVWDKNENSE